jgi:hypothetical protein
MLFGASIRPECRSCSSLDSTLTALDANGDQMATWTYRRASVTAEDASVLASKPLLLFKKNGPVVFTKNYVKHRLFSKKRTRRGPRA